jgi:hypothetical protein
MAVRTGIVIGVGGQIGIAVATATMTTRSQQS